MAGHGVSVDPQIDPTVIACVVDGRSVVDTSAVCLISGESVVERNVMQSYGQRPRRREKSKCGCVGVRMCWLAMLRHTAPPAWRSRGSGHMSQ